MLTVSPARTAGGAASYYLHLKEEKDGTPEDYYSKEGDAGRWMGSGAVALGLEGHEVRGEDFRAMAAGISPEGNELVRNAGDPDRRAGWDMTFSAPKSVSVVWAFADPELRERIEACQARAVEAAFGYMEERAALARVGHHGAGAENSMERVGWAAAAFQHGTSRDQDMQLHTHAFVFNQGHRENGQWASLESREMMRWAKAGGAAYRAELAQGLREMGYTIERDGESFRLASIPREVEQHFSQGRERVLAELERRGLEGARAAELANMTTRTAKGEIDQAQLQASWDQRLQALNYEHKIVQPREVQAEQPAERAPADILERATEMKSVIEERDIALAAMQEAQVGGGLARGQDLTDATLQEAVTLTRIDDWGREIVRYSSQELIEKENDILAGSLARQAETSHHLDKSGVDAALDRVAKTKGFQLSAEQRAAVHHLTRESGGVALLEGDAGTGKSTTLEAVREAYEASGYRVMGTAIAAKAAGGLEGASGIESTTAARMVGDLEAGRLELTCRDVIVMDEAGMADSRNLHKLTEAAREAGAKVILAGDHKQLPPVAAGAPFRALVQGQNHARLQEVIRQRDGWAREAVRDFSRGDAAKAMLAHIKHGRVEVANTHKAAVKTAASHYVKAAAEVGKDKALAIAATNKGVNDLNREIRDQLKDRGELSGERQIETANDKLELAPGDRVVIEKNDKEQGLQNGDFATVRGFDGDKTVLKLDRTGEMVAIKPDQTHIRHGYASTTHKAQGVTVERPVMLANENSSREMAYVQASRGREGAQIVVSKSAIDKMAEKTAPTEKQLASIERIAAVKGIQRPEPANMREASEWLKAQGQREPNKGPEDQRLREMREVVKAMKKPSSKENTTDYQVKLPPRDGPEKPQDKNGPEPSPERVAATQEAQKNEPEKAPEQEKVAESQGALKCPDLDTPMQQESQGPSREAPTPAPEERAAEAEHELER